MKPSGQEHQICVQVSADCDDAEVDQSALVGIAKAVCGRFALSDATVDIMLVDDARFRRLNKQYLDKDGVSDCLSFDLSDECRADSPRTFEVVLNVQQATRQADLRGHAIDAELALYLVHGLLHNLGFDDIVESGARIMHEMEDTILQELGYGLVYNANVKRQKRRKEDAGE